MIDFKTKLNHNYMLSRESLETFPSKSGVVGCPLSPVLLSGVLQFLSKVKRKTNHEVLIELSAFQDNMLTC